MEDTISEDLFPTAARVASTRRSEGRPGKQRIHSMIDLKVSWLGCERTGGIEAFVHGDSISLDA